MDVEKSTLLSILAGFECYESGNIPEEESRGVVFQSPALFPWLTVKGNVEYGLKRKGIPKGERKEQVETFLKMVQLEDYAKYYPRELSGGMQQRAALARTLVLRPEMLLMDEPFSALDPKLRIQMQQLTLELWKELKQTIFIVTHDVEEAVMVADIIYLMGESPQGVRRKVEVSWVKKEENRNTKKFFELKKFFIKYLKYKEEEHGYVLQSRRSGKVWNNGRRGSTVVGNIYELLWFCIRRRSTDSKREVVNCTGCCICNSVSVLH